jgi:hypothetical protein
LNRSSRDLGRKRTGCLSAIDKTSGWLLGGLALCGIVTACQTGAIRDKSGAVSVSNTRAVERDQSRVSNGGRAGSKLLIIASPLCYNSRRKGVLSVRHCHRVLIAWLCELESARFARDRPKQPKQPQAPRPMTDPARDPPSRLRFHTVQLVENGQSLRRPSRRRPNLPQEEGGHWARGLILLSQRDM